MPALASRTNPISLRSQTSLAQVVAEHDLRRGPSQGRAVNCSTTAVEIAFTSSVVGPGSLTNAALR